MDVEDVVDRCVKSSDHFALTGTPGRFVTPMPLESINPSRLLLYGADPMLLETRARVLRSAGATVDIVGDWDTLIARMASRPAAYDLLVCCHSVTKTVSDDVIDIASQNGMATLRLERLLLPRELIGQVSKLIDAARSRRESEKEDSAS
jgi:hypothetical protein